MNYVETTLIQKYGEDDFSFWLVDIEEQDYKAAMTDYVRMSGEAKNVLNKLLTVEEEPDTVLHFLTANNSGVTVISTQVDESFLGKYQNRGYSSRGSMNDILAELDDLNADEAQLPIGEVESENEDDMEM